MIAVMLIIALCVLLAIGVPVAYCFGILAFTVALMGDMSLNFVCSIAYQAIDSFTLMAVFFFILAGDLMARGGIGQALIDFFYFTMRRVKGGLALVIPVASAFFGALSGSSTATTAAIGGIMIPQMERYGYEKRYSAALCAVSGWIGALIPPSITLILYALVSNQSIAALFLATIIPGLILTLAFMIINTVISSKYIDQDQANRAERERVKIGRRPDAPSVGLSKRTALLGFLNEFRISFYRAIPAFIAPFIVLGGIYGGFSPRPRQQLLLVHMLRLLDYSFIENLKLKT